MKYCRPSHLITRQIANQTLLVPLKHDGASLQHVYLLNETAAAIWELLQEPRTPEQIVTSLLEEYEAAPEVVREDTLGTLEDLASRHFVEIVDE